MALLIRLKTFCRIFTLAISWWDQPSVEIRIKLLVLAEVTCVPYSTSATDIRLVGSKEKLISIYCNLTVAAAFELSTDETLETCVR